MYTYNDFDSLKELQKTAKELQLLFSKTKDGFPLEINKEYWTITNRGLLKVKFNNKIQLLQFLFKLKENAIVFYLKQLEKKIDEQEKELKRIKKLYEKYNLRESI